MTQIWTYFLVDTSVPALMTFTTGLKQMIFFDGGPFQLRLSISRINSSVKWWGCGRQGHDDKGPVITCPETITKRSQNVLSVTCSALTLAHLGSKMLGCSVQFLIGTLVNTSTRLEVFKIEGDMTSNQDWKSWLRPCRNRPFLQGRNQDWILSTVD